MTDFDRREFLAGAAIAATATAAMLGTRKAEAGDPSFMNNVPDPLLAGEELPTFKFALEKSKAKVIGGSTAREATVLQLPISKGIAGVSMGLEPGAMRELHWHPLSDEWQYYVSGKGRMTVFQAGGKARTFDFQAGDVGYIRMSRPHYVENTGTEDLVFLEVFPIGTYQDISASEWLAHTPARLVDQHLKTGEDFLNKIPKQEAVVTPI